MKPAFIINTHDYVKLIANDGLKPVINVVVADGSGRDTLDALMWLSRVADKQKWTVSFLRMGAKTLVQLGQDLAGDFVKITMLDPMTNTLVEKEYFYSAINCGIQRHIGGKTVYDGVTFNITER